MQFLDATNKTGLVEEADFICNTDSVSYPTAQKARNANRWLYKVVVNIMKAQGKKWRYDDPNNSGNATTTDNLVDTQARYTLPTSILTLDSVEVLDSGGNARRLKFLTLDDMKTTVTDYKTADGLPREYRLEGEDIILEPAVAASDVTLADGLIYHYTREVDGFAATDTTQEPGFAEPFHRIISLGMAYDWLLVNGPLDKADRVRQEIEVLMADLREFYSDRARDAKASIQPAHRQRDFF